MAPLRAQVERQLKDIVESAVFSGGDGFKPNRQLVRLLRFIVSMTLDGKNLKERILLKEFFKLNSIKAGPENAIARRAVGRLRKRLDLYYATLGIEAPLQIEIPDEQYYAKFTPLMNSEAQRELRLGFYHVDRESPDRIALALNHFETAIREDNNLAEAYAGKAYALLTMTLHAFSDDPKDLFRKAESAANEALALDNQSWRAHVVIGAIHLYRHDWDSADKSFIEAGRISPLKVIRMGLMGPYLLGLGKYKQGLELAKLYIHDGLEDEILLGHASLYLYALRNFAEAEKTIKKALQLEPYFWRTHLILAFILLAQNKPQEALSHMQKIEPIAELNLWPGMKIICLDSAGESKQAKKEFATLKNSSKSKYIQPMQLALGHMAMGESVEAIGYLSRACDEHDPFTAWLHLWPLLDPLRQCKEFQALIRKWKFPSA